MGIYIKDIEMPTVGHILITFPSGRTLEVSADKTQNILREAQAISITQHGRLGDLDKLVEKIDGIWDCNDMVFKPDDHCCNVPEDCKGCKWAQTKDCIQRMVENAPTIIPAEEEMK